MEILLRSWILVMSPALLKARPVTLSSHKRPRTQTLLRQPRRWVLYRSHSNFSDHSRTNSWTPIQSLASLAHSISAQRRAMFSRRKANRLRLLPPLPRQRHRTPPLQMEPRRTASLARPLWLPVQTLQVLAVYLPRSPQRLREARAERGLRLPVLSLQQLARHPEKRYKVYTILMRRDGLDYEMHSDGVRVS